MTTMDSTRNASLMDLRDLLLDEHSRKVDVVVPAMKMRSVGGVIHVQDTQPVLSEDGVTMTTGRYRPTVVFDEGIADKLKVPLAYVRRMRAEAIDQYDDTVNGWLHGCRAKIVAPRTGVDEPPQQVYGPRGADPRSFLLRLFKPADGDALGVARSMHSDSYKVIDNLDVLTAALDGVRASGADVKVTGCDLSDRRMIVRVTAPQVQVMAEALLRDYRSPFSGARGLENPLVFAGFEISNSEVGCGAFVITPRAEIQVCSNGMKIQKDLIRAVHLGGKLDEGIIEWSAETKQKQVELVRAKTADAVRTFVDADYWRRQIDAIEEKAGTPVVLTPERVKSLQKTLQFDETTMNGVFDHFVKGGDPTAGGLMNAVTSWAQVVPDPDLAADLEGQALQVLEVAALAGRG